MVGNEDGAHHTTAQGLQALNDLGFSIPAAANAVHLACPLKTNPSPARGRRLALKGRRAVDVSIP